MDATAAYGASVIAGVPAECHSYVSVILVWTVLIYIVAVSNYATKSPQLMRLLQI